MSGKYGAGQDPYCYPHSAVLRNKLGIRNDLSLSAAEQLFSTLAAQSLEFNPPPYDLNYLKNIHLTLFADLYDWAGALRTVGISKQGTRFCQPAYMEKEAGKVFQIMAAANWFDGMSRTELISAVALTYSELNVVHPFRDGNGRAQRILFEHLIMNAGFEISWWGVEGNEWLQANIAAYNGHLEPMERVFEHCIGQPLQA
ncbi:putative adenosine monophosphate-protein transferase Fic [Pseudomonas sp. Au-Pse12]|uniref:putative adenosine monophosphate-protein transferase Fic n=1 Tax=Pseudomonas sp. Au-Pse12 TaxID=2906459 RepID=UPI001E2E1C67|nr:putative adenosine monophosphate-protein transferase Fic [Pseudomonas sp. Au-Pse12]MCE4053082.1 putative adenosine monophosphate-protein transferase Fic [Pseudomonas sp. Au-Pse12]